ncbi:cytochrome P450 4C1-like [Schistocerca cancellata]|uniref:cytochrome P450 4C1-like n=1 Tax=Schistocerca cancellata TaxID=274614 RepID=UPI002117E3C6|nr:cytochrome P450 4C1-like [Schistocerca cancellata]
MDGQDLLVVGVAVALLVALVQHVSRNWRLWRSVGCLPGPPALPIVGTAWLFVVTKREGLLALVRKVMKSHGTVFRMWYGNLPEVHIINAENIEKVLSSCDLITKSVHYTFLRPWLGEGLLTSAGNKWQRRRKMLTPAFHFKILENFVGVFAEKSKVLLEKLRKKAEGPEFDIYPSIALCSLDIICETAMGTCVNAQEDAGSEYVSATCSVTELTMKRVLKPWLYPDFIFRMTPSGRQYYKCLDTVHQFSKQVITERRKERQRSALNVRALSQDNTGVKHRVAFLDLLLDMSMNGENLDDADIQEEVDTFMFEGHDTTAAAMSWAVFLLGHHPDVQQKAFEELNEIFQGSDRLPTFQDLQNMKYLEMVIKETLRLYPSVPFIGRINSKESESGGYKLPEGVMLVLHVYESHRDPKHWPDPERFDPDNFLPERVQGRHPFAYVPFSGGPRSCIGQKFALLEEKTVLSSLLRNYVIESVERRENMKVTAELILRPMNGIKVKLRTR